MSHHTEDNLRYPVGRFHFEGKASQDELEDAIRNIATLPAWLKEITLTLTEKELDQTYRNDGWTIRQVIHHMADSHMNAYIRFKLALTENQPVVKPYEESLWAELADAKNGNILPSLEIVDGIHSRWTTLMEHMESKDFEKAFMHPEHNRLISLAECACMYSWHGRHHLGHIQRALNKIK